MDSYTLRKAGLRYAIKHYEYDKAQQLNLYKVHFGEHEERMEQLVAYQNDKIKMLQGLWLLNEAEYILGIIN